MPSLFIDKLKYTINADGTSVSVARQNRFVSGFVTIPSVITYQEKTYTVSSIAISAFDGCQNLTSVTIPSTVLTIGEWAFAGCTSLLQIMLQKDHPAFTVMNGALFDKEVKTLIAFPAGRDGKTYTLPDTVTTVGVAAFDSCDNVSSVIIPEGVTTIQNHAFGGCYRLCSVIFPSTLASIGKYAFYRCSSLRSVVIPSGVSLVDNFSFRECDNLSSVTIPETVTEIGNNAFDGCVNLREFHIHHITPPELFRFNYLGGLNRPFCTLYVPVGTKEDCMQSPLWSRFTRIREEAIQGIKPLTE
ncbi:MAG: leucine-rich repeat domain-containing protein [Bacteroidales bacterium]|nr:leucine-rich repeat domain-containing protein [Bacteroidales bacterium]